jgi:hypothetical protein
MVKVHQTRGLITLESRTWTWKPEDSPSGICPYKLYDVTWASKKENWWSIKQSVFGKVTATALYSFMQIKLWPPEMKNGGLSR